MGLPETEAGVQVKIDRGGVSSMVSTGRTASYRLHVAALGGLAALLLVGAAPIQPPSQQQRPAKTAQSQIEANTNSRQGMTAYERESLVVDRAANRIAEAANRISADQLFYAFCQLLLGGVGVVFTGVAALFAWRATHWAKTAAQETKRSADADNANLIANREGLDAARADAKVQADRLAEQVELSRSANAAAQKTADVTERALIGMERPMIVPILIGGVGIDAANLNATLHSNQQVTIRNIGRTTGFLREVAIGEHIPGKHFGGAEELPAHPRIVLKLLGPGESHPLEGMASEMGLGGRFENIQAYMQRKWRIYGWVIYDDLFTGVTYKRNFRYGPTDDGRFVPTGGRAANHEERIDLPDNEGEFQD